MATTSAPRSDASPEDDQNAAPSFNYELVECGTAADHSTASNSLSDMIRASWDDLLIDPAEGERHKVDIGISPDAAEPSFVATTVKTHGAPNDARVRVTSNRVVVDHAVASDTEAPARDLLIYHTGQTLLVWITLVIMLNGLIWVTGLKPLALTRAVEQGAARVESRAVGEVSESTIRKAILTQRKTISFWKTLMLISDFVAEPLSLLVRALAVTTLLSGAAALVGRTVGFNRSWHENVRCQGFWVLGLAIQTILSITLRTTEVDTSLGLLLPPGTYRAPLWAAYHQADIFALWGWAALVWGGWRRGQTNLATSFTVCASVAACELACRVVFVVLTGAGMRLSVLPDIPLTKIGS